jgi:hypothetical protein
MEKAPFKKFIIFGMSKRAASGETRPLSPIKPEG